MSQSIEGFALKWLSIMAQHLKVEVLAFGISNALALFVPKSTLTSFSFQPQMPSCPRAKPSLSFREFCMDKMHAKRRTR